MLKMTNLAYEENHFQFTSFTIICMVSTFALGWCLLQEFVSELLQSRDKDKLYGDIMQLGMIILIFNISKFYLLLCFRKKLEIVDLVDSETDETEKSNKVGVHEDSKDNHKGDTHDRTIMEGQNTDPQVLRRDQGVGESSADLNMYEEQNQGEIFPEINDSNLEDDVDGTNRQDNQQVHGQSSQDNESGVGRVLALDDIQVHMHRTGYQNMKYTCSGYQNMKPQRNKRDKKTSERCRSLSMSEENYTSSRSQDGPNIKTSKRQSSIRRGDAEPPKPSQKKQSISSKERTPSLYDLRHRSCFS